MYVCMHVCMYVFKYVCINMCAYEYGWKMDGHVHVNYTMSLCYKCTYHTFLKKGTSTEMGSA